MVDLVSQVFCNISLLTVIEDILCLWIVVESRRSWISWGKSNYGYDCRLLLKFWGYTHFCALCPWSGYPFAIRPSVSDSPSKLEKDKFWGRISVNRRSTMITIAWSIFYSSHSQFFSCFYVHYVPAIQRLFTYSLSVLWALSTDSLFTRWASLEYPRGRYYRALA